MQGKEGKEAFFLSSTNEPEMHFLRLTRVTSQQAFPSLAPKMVTEIIERWAWKCLSSPSLLFSSPIRTFPRGRKNRCRPISLFYSIEVISWVETCRFRTPKFSPVSCVCGIDHRGNTWKRDIIERERESGRYKETPLRPRSAYNLLYTEKTAFGRSIQLFKFRTHFSD